MIQQQIVASIFKINLRTRTVARSSLLTLAVVLTILPSAQAQTLNELYSFTGGLDGSSPWGQLLRWTRLAISIPAPWKVATTRVRAQLSS